MHRHATLVIGTESLGDEQDVAALRALPPDRYVLSLDFKDDRFDGPRRGTRRAAALAARRHRHDARARRLRRRARPAAHRRDRRRAPAAARVYAAGGVRNRADIEALHAAGAAGVLIATALHAGTIKAGDLEEIAGL